jgi:hypothetical protein
LLSKPAKELKMFAGADHGIRVGTTDGGRVPAPGFERFLMDWVERVTR